MKTRSFLRAGIIFVLLLGLGWFGIWILGQPGASIKISSPDNSSAEPLLTNDNYYNFGGKTSDDTIKLLIYALERNDLALAAKYFVPEIREAISGELKKLSDSHLTSDLIKTLKDLKTGYAADNSHWRYKVTDSTGQPAFVVDLIKNKNGIWKIDSF